MDCQITTEYLESMRWLDSKVPEQYWEKDETGEKVILRSGWRKAQTEYNRIKSVKGNYDNELKK